MILYHGTSVSNSAIIEVEGLQPRKDEGNWFRDYQVPSTPDKIYLTTDYVLAEFYALRAMIKCNDTNYSIVTVSDLETENFFPDENLYSNKSEYYKDELVEYQKLQLSNQLDWEESLHKLNMVSHHGPINNKNIVNITSKPMSENNFFGMIKHFDEVNIDNLEISSQILFSTQAMGFLSKKFEVIPKASNKYLLLLDNRELIINYSRKHIT